MTVWEAVMFSAALRLPSDMPMSEKAERAVQVLKDLRISHVADSYIGSQGHRCVWVDVWVCVWMCVCVCVCVPIPCPSHNPTAPRAGGRHSSEDMTHTQHTGASRAARSGACRWRWSWSRCPRSSSWTSLPPGRSTPRLYTPLDVGSMIMMT
jgi:hypothetical protein